ncbi:winged helix-turn-helix transcriptional regulator [Amycolatopsis sp. NPDC098790]|uniref:winged helix-turn-helix transcriptional regulator n=1 Tax=Amycolatopsis sp. NPDC098790 TaxID=3363939 RepID=UPI003810CEEF
MALPRNKTCSIARSLEVLGQKWNLLILREVFLGRTRFAEFREIGVPTDVLTKRLKTLVDDGLLQRRPYQQAGERARDEYILTSAGRDLLPILAALMTWGDVHRPTGSGPATLCVDQETDRPVHLAFTDGETLISDPAQVHMRHNRRVDESC